MTASRLVRVKEGVVGASSRGAGFTRKLSPGLFSANTSLWGTPRAVFDALDAEFVFDLDPCPGEATLRGWLRVLSSGLDQSWLPFVNAFVNPPYGPPIRHWIEKALHELALSEHPSNVVMLLPARTDTAWWHDLVLPYAREIRFIRGRLGFTGIPTKPELDRTKQRSRAPFPSVVVVL